MRIMMLLLVALALSACATGEKNVRDAATTPLSDLNVVRADIPPVLSAAQKAPYAAPADKSCAALAADVQTLDAALGADLDTPATGANPSLIERGAADALRNTAEGVIPFRGWVRKLSGAERYSPLGPSKPTLVGLEPRALAPLRGCGEAAPGVGCE